MNRAPEAGQIIGYSEQSGKIYYGQPGGPVHESWLGTIGRSQFTEIARLFAASHGFSIRPANGPGETIWMFEFIAPQRTAP